MLPKGWDILPLEDIAQVERGKFSVRPRNDPRYFGGDVPFVQTGDVASAKGAILQHSQTLNALGASVSRIFPKGTILLTIAANIGAVAITTYPVACPDSVVGIAPKEQTNVIWLLSFLEQSQKTLESRATQNAQKNINLETLRPLSVWCPPKVEQDQIANCLSLWVVSITHLESLIATKREQKKALAQRLLTGKQRFPEFAKEPWSQVSLKNLFKEVKTKVGDSNATPHSISAGIGFVSHEEKWGKDSSGEQYQNYVLLQAGQFAYNKGNSKKYQCGCMYLYKGDKPIAVPNVFISFERRNAKVCNEFYEQYFIADYCARELKKYITSGARANGLLNLSKQDYFSVKVPCPSIKEQQKIAATLGAVDQEIALLVQKLKALKEQKKGLMQQLLTGKKRVKIDKKEAA